MNKLKRVDHNVKSWGIHLSLNGKETRLLAIVSRLDTHPEVQALPQRYLSRLLFRVGCPNRLIERAKGICMAEITDLPQVVLTTTVYSRLAVKCHNNGHRSGCLKVRNVLNSAKSLLLFNA